MKLIAISKTILNNTKNLFYYKNTYKMDMSIEMSNAINWLLIKLSTNISPTHINSFTSTHNKIMIIANTDIMKHIKRILPNNIGLSIQHTTSKLNTYTQYEYIIDIQDFELLERYFINQNMKQISSRYKTKSYIDTEDNTIIIETDHKLDNPYNGNVNIRILGIDNSIIPLHNIYEMPYKMDSKIEKHMNKMGFNYKENVSDPILTHNFYNQIIDSVMIYDNILVLKLNEDAFFQATEIYNNDKYAQLVVEIDGKIYSKIKLTDIIKQTIQIHNIDRDKILNFKEAISNPIALGRLGSLRIIREDFNHILRLLMLILLLCLLVYLIIMRKNKIKYIILSIIFGVIGFNYKFTYTIMLNILGILIMDLLSKYINYYQKIILSAMYVVLSICFALFYNIGYSMNLLPMYHLLSSLVILIFNIPK